MPSVFLGSTLVWNEFGILINVPLEELIGIYVLATHFYSHLYLKNIKKRLHSAFKHVRAAVSSAATPKSSQ